MINFYKKVSKPKKTHNPNFRHHKIKVPFRMAIVGGSGSGKTCTALNIIKKMNNTFEHLIICCKSRDEPLYELLTEKLSKDVLKFYENGEVPNINDLGDIGQSLIIFDDLVLKKKQEDISEFFIRGRKKDLSMMYLSQDYYGIPKVVRSQCNYIILKKIQSANDLNLILRDFTLGLTKDELYDKYNLSIKDDFLNFFMIDLEASSDDKLKYRKNFKAI